MDILPLREKLVLRPKESSQDRVGAAGRLSASGNATPRSTKNAAYLFVNKTQESECLSNCKTDRTQTKINAHVQRFKLKTHANLGSSGD
jgi:hypothetical protein